MNSFQHEIYRKSFHFASLIFPLIYLVTSKTLMVSALTIITVFTVTIDIFRHKNSKIQEYTDKILGIFMRPNEKSGSGNLSGSSFMALGLLSTSFFDKNISIISWLILIISDSMAAIIGRKYGTKNYLLANKSIVGTGAFFISTIIIIISSSLQLDFVTIIFISAIVSLVELYAVKMKINDNLAIPLSFCIIMELII